MTQGFVTILGIYSDKTGLTEALTTFVPTDKNVMMTSPAGRLMLGANGLRSTVQQSNEIVAF